MLRLMRTQVRCDLGLERRIGLAEKMQHQDVFGGNRAVGLELEQPVARCVLQSEQRLTGGLDRAIQRRLLDEPLEARRAHLPARARLVESRLKSA